MWFRRSALERKFKMDMDTTPATNGPPTVAVVAKDGQVTYFFMTLCDFEVLRKRSVFVIKPRTIENKKFIEIHKDLINFKKPQERLVVGECIGFIQKSQGVMKQ